MQVIRLPPVNMSWITQVRILSALKDLDHQVGIGGLSENLFHMESTLLRPMRYTMS